MKKCILCMVLLCFALAACATVTNQPATTTAPQTNATTLPSSSTTTTFPPTRPTTRPTPYKDPICYIRHTFENGICKYCKAKDPNHTGTYPTENFCAQGHTYAGPYCVYCLAVNPDYAKCESTHTYQNGYCIYCRAVDANYDFCAQGHTFKNGFCAYCGIADEDYHPCQGGHTFQNGYCIYCLNQQPSAGQPTTVRPTTRPTTKPVIYTDYKCMYGGHVYQNGNCIYCGRKQSAGDVGAPQPTTSRPAYLCAMGDHEIEDGYCVHCGRVEPKDVDGTLIVNGNDITEGNYVKVNEGYNNSKLPLTAILTALGVDWKWESDTLLRIDLKGEDMVLDLDHPQFDWTVPPGTLGGVRWVIDGEVIVDGTSLNLLLRNLDIIMTTDYDTNTVLIARVMP